MKFPLSSVLLPVFFLMVETPASAQVTLEPEWLLGSVAPAEDDQFGTSVALDGDTLAVGAVMSAPLYSTGPGRVEVFRGGGPGWAHEGTLVPPGGMLADHFGESLALDGDTIVVGAPYADSQAPTSGAGYVYVRTATGWQFQQQLFPAGTGPGYRLGTAVDIEGDRLVLGGAGGFGRAHVFERQGGVWSEVQRLAPAVLADPDHFGDALDLDGDRLVVSAPGHDGGGKNTGALFLFERVGTHWQETAKLVGPVDSLLGMVVALDGDLVAATEFTGPAGRGYAWHHDGMTWVPEGSFESSGGWSLQALDIHDSTMVVSGRDDRAVVFTRVAGRWSESMVLTGVHGAGAFRVDQVDLDGEQLVIGATGAVASPPWAGGAYVFHLSGRHVEVICESQPGSTGKSATLGVDGGLSVAADDLRLHVLDATPNSVALLTCGAHAVQYPFANGTLCIDPLGGIHRVGGLALGPGGHAVLDVHLVTMPSTVAIGPGESWIFQAWYRDALAGGARFNLTGAVRLTFVP